MFKLMFFVDFVCLLLVVCVIVVEGLIIVIDQVVECVVLSYWFLCYGWYVVVFVIYGGNVWILVVVEDDILVFVLLFMLFGFWFVWMVQIFGCYWLFCGFGLVIDVIDVVLKVVFVMLLGEVNGLCIGLVQDGDFVVIVLIVVVCVVGWVVIDWMVGIVWMFDFVFEQDGQFWFCNLMFCKNCFYEKYLVEYGVFDW